jgi:hypothetical protein
MMTQDFAETIRGRVATDEAFRMALEDEIARLLLSGDEAAAKALSQHLQQKTGVHLAVLPQSG